MRSFATAVAAIAAAVALTLAGCGGGSTDDHGDSQSSPPTVTELMDTAGVDGEVIAQQLYSRETGRGTIDGHRVTVATFDDNANRDQWADAARDLGQTVRVGELWAAAASDAAGPDLFAERVGDQGV